MSLVLITAPLAPALSLLEAAQLLKQADTQEQADALPDKDLIESLCQVVTEQAEAETNRQLMEATYQLRLDDFSAYVELPKYPTKSIEKVEYIGTDNTLKTLPDSEYLLDTGSKPCRLILNDPGDVKSTLGTLRITFVAGGEVPKMVSNGMKMLLGHYYDNREEVVVGTINTQNKVGAERCFALSKVDYFA